MLYSCNQMATVGVKGLNEYCIVLLMESVTDRRQTDTYLFDEQVSDVVNTTIMPQSLSVNEST